MELLVPSSLPHVGEGVYIIRPSGPVDVRGDEIWLGPSPFLTGRSHKQTEKFLAESCMKIRKKLSCFFSAGAGFSSCPDGWRLSVVWCCGPRQRSRDHEMPGQERALREVRTDRNRPQLTPCSRAVPGRDETWVGACPRQRQERTSWVGAREQATMPKLDQGLSLLFYTIDSSRTSRTVGELSCARDNAGFVPIVILLCSLVPRWLGRPAIVSDGRGPGSQSSRAGSQGSLYVKEWDKEAIAG